MEIILLPVLIALNQKCFIIKILILRCHCFQKRAGKKADHQPVGKSKQKSYECNDDYLAAFVSGVYGRYMFTFGETEAAVMYMMNSADLYEKVHLSAECRIYEVLGEMLWRVTEYEKCIKYTRKAIELVSTWMLNNETGLPSSVRIQDHSVLKLFTGLAIAALID